MANKNPTATHAHYNRAEDRQAPRYAFPLHLGEYDEREKSCLWIEERRYENAPYRNELACSGVRSNFGPVQSYRKPEKVSTRRYF
jgi:hypothetical protein